MLYLAEGRALQAEQVSRECVVDDLTPAILQRLVLHHPARKQSLHLTGVLAFVEDLLPGLATYLIDLERLDEFQLAGQELALRLAGT